MTNWSTDPPTDPGWYQYRPPDAGLIVFYKIDSMPSGELIVTIDQSLEQMDLQNMPGEWRGPIVDIAKWR